VKNLETSKETILYSHNKPVVAFVNILFFLKKGYNNYFINKLQKKTSTEGFFFKIKQYAKFYIKLTSSSLQKTEGLSDKIISGNETSLWLRNEKFFTITTFLKADKKFYYEILFKTND